MQVWISIGTPENWRTALSENVWGIVEGLKNLWEKLQKGDLLLCYATSPVKGIIAVVRIENKFKQDKPLWERELRENRVIWPYRYDFKVEFALPPTDWPTKRVSTSGLNINIRAGLNSIKDKEAIKLVFERIDQVWNTKLSKLLEEVPVKPLVKKEIAKNLHDEIKEKLLELGRIERFIVEKEYPIQDLGERVDVVWRRVVASVPTYVFEIQIGGNLHQAIAKLKHAFDIWNSNIFLIYEEKDYQKITSLLSGTFHEIKDKIKLVPVEKIQKVYEIQTQDDKVKKEIGLR